MERYTPKEHNMDEPSNLAEAYLALAANYRQALEEIKRDPVSVKLQAIQTERSNLSRWIEPRSKMADRAEAERLRPLVNECFHLNQELVAIQTKNIAAFQQQIVKLNKGTKQAKRFAAIPIPDPNFVDRQG